MPNSGPLNSIVEIGGYRFHGTLDFYERFFIGGYICDTRDPTTNQQYGIRWKWPLLYIKCRITEQQVGGWNATAIVSRTRGTTWNHTEAVYPVHDWDLAMYELYPGEMLRSAVNSYNLYCIFLITVEPLYCGHLNWGPSNVSCIERCPHFRGKFILREYIWDIVRCPV